MLTTRRIPNLFIAIGLAFVGIAPVCHAGAPPEIMWGVDFDTPGTDYVCDVATDTSGFLHVTGMAGLPGGADFWTAKYGPDGGLLWEHFYDSGNPDIGRSVAVDGAGNTYVSGTASQTTGSDHWIIKYDPEGNVLWDQVYNASDSDLDGGVAFGHDGYVYVAGTSSSPSDTDSRLMKLDEQGHQLWIALYNSGSEDFATGIAAGSDGGVYVASVQSSAGLVQGVHTLKYDGGGALVWEAFYTVDFQCDAPVRIAVDDSGFVYLASPSFNGTDHDILVIAYDYQGNEQGWWGYDSGVDDIPEDIAVDRGGSVYIIGEHVDAAGFDKLLLKYDFAEPFQWVLVTDDGSDEYGWGVTVDPRGFIYTCGWHGPTGSESGLIQKHRQFLSIRGRVTDAGVGMEGVEVGIVGAVSSVSVTAPDGGYVFNDLPCGEDYVVRPQRPGYVFDPPDRPFTPLAFDMDRQDFQAVLNADGSLRGSLLLQVLNPSQSPVSLRYELPADVEVRLSMHDLSGRLVGRPIGDRQPAGSHAVRWEAPGPGTYLVRLQTEGSCTTRRIVVLP